MRTLAERQQADHVHEKVDEKHGGTVMFHPCDGNNFALDFQTIVRACRSHDNATEYANQIQQLVEQLVTWIRARGDEIVSASLKFEANGVLFVVMRNAKAFDIDFEDALSALDLKIAQDPELSQINMRVLGLPYASTDTLASFVGTQQVMHYVGHNHNR